MSDRDLWHWDGFNAAEDWTAWDTKAVLAQGKELKKRAQAAGWGYDARKLESGGGASGV
jgi:hypothetical protein